MLSAAVKVPNVHASQSRFALAVPTWLTWVPGPQIAQAVQLASLLEAVKVPAAHAMQVRLVVELPGETTCSPGAQVVRGTQAVTGSASWSQSLAAQVCFGVAPPGQ